MMQVLKRLFSFDGKREIYRIYVAHTVYSIAMSFVSIYVPIFFLSRGYSLTQVVGYFILLHLSGLLAALTIIPWCIERFGILRVFKWNYVFGITYYGLLFLFDVYSVPIPVIAILGGLATFFYWIPLNIFLLKNSDFDKMGSDMANFFALPKMFSIVGPLLSAGLIYFFGFWPTFVIAMIGSLLSYLPLASLPVSAIVVKFRFGDAWQELKRRKTLFFLEGFDNIIEESEWFWGIYVYLLIGSLVTPGIVGSLESLGAVLFTIFMGKLANKKDKTLVIVSSAGIMVLSLARMFVETQWVAYAVSLIASFLFTAFLVSYFSVIYRAVKGKNEEEFIILREIPTVIGRMIVFGSIILTVSHPNMFFILPIVATAILLIIFLGRMKLTAPPSEL